MKPFTVGQKAQVALFVIWSIAGLLVLAAKAAAPSPSSVLAWLHAHEAATDRELLARELPLRLSRLGFGEQQRVIDTPEFARTLASLDRDQMCEFLSVAVPQGICALLAETRRVPEGGRELYFRQSLDRIRRQMQPNDPRVDSALLKLLAQQGIAMYEDGAGSGDREVMMPLIQQLSSRLEWL